MYSRATRCASSSDYIKMRPPLAVQLSAEFHKFSILTAKMKFTKILALFCLFKTIAAIKCTNHCQLYDSKAFLDFIKLQKLRQKARLNFVVLPTMF